MSFVISRLNSPFPPQQTQPERMPTLFLFSLSLFLCLSSLCVAGKVLLRETREWPLLTVETEVNRDSKSTNERGPFFVGSLGLPCQYKRILFCLGCSGRPSTKSFPHHTPFQVRCPPSPGKLGGLAVGSRLLVCVYGLAYFFS
jgi:hypothetical protein